MRMSRVVVVVSALVLVGVLGCRTEKRDDSGQITSTDFGLPYETPGLDVNGGPPVALSGVTQGALKSVRLVERGDTFVIVEFECPDGTKGGQVRVDIPAAPVPPAKTSQGPYADTGCKKDGKPVRINVTRNK